MVRKVLIAKYGTVWCIWLKIWLPLAAGNSPKIGSSVGKSAVVQTFLHWNPNLYVFCCLKIFWYCYIISVLHQVHLVEHPSFWETDNVVRSKRALIKYLQSRIMKGKDVLLLHLRLNVENAVQKFMFNFLNFAPWRYILFVSKRIFLPLLPPETDQFWLIFFSLIRSFGWIEMSFYELQFCGWDRCHL